MKSILNVTHLPSALLSAGRFVLHFIEMLVAMMAGMLVFHALPLGLERTSTPYQVAMAIAMTVPMVAWMRVRGHGWRHGIEIEHRHAHPVGSGACPGRYGSRLGSALARPG